jgi:hypothetical protein
LVRQLKHITYALIATFVFSAILPAANKVEAKVFWGKMELKPGMIGKITILKDTNLYRIKDNKFYIVRKAKKGQEFGVYSDRYQQGVGRLYGLGMGIYVPQSSAIKYEKVPKTMMEQLKREQRKISISPEQYIKQTGYNISYYYENLITGDKFAYGGTKVYRAASTIKLPLALYVYKLAAEHKINLEEKLTYKRYHYYGGSGIIQKARVGTKYTIRDLVKYAIVHSDNIAFIMLKEKVGQNNFVRFMRSLGGKVTYPKGKNMTTAEDLVTYAKAVYQFEKQSPQLGRELVYYLKHTDYQTTIPAGVPHLEVAHKVGYIPMELIYNDVGIVYDAQPYVLAIMTTGIPYNKEEKIIAELTKIIHQNHVSRYQSSKTR